MRGWWVCAWILLPTAAWSQDGLPLPDAGGLERETPRAEREVDPDPQAQAFAARVAPAIGSPDLLEARRTTVTAHELLLLEQGPAVASQPSKGRDEPIGEQLKLEFEGVSILWTCLRKNGEAFRYAAAVMGERHDAWGALDESAGPVKPRDFLEPELVVLRGKEVLMAWGPALEDLPTLQRLAATAWSPGAGKSPVVARAVFHRDRTAAFVDKPHGHVYEQMQTTLARAGDLEQPLGVRWIVQGRHLAFEFDGGFCGEVDSDAGGGRYWIARRAEQRDQAEALQAWVSGAVEEPTRGLKDALPR